MGNNTDIYYAVRGLVEKIINLFNPCRACIFYWPTKRVLCPYLRTPHYRQSLKYSLLSCETRTIVIPSSSRSFNNSLSRDSDVTGSSPADGSSQNSNSGSRAIALASDALFLIPPDNSNGNLFIALPSPTRFNFTLTILVYYYILANSYVAAGE